jgi:predicted nucleotidyltransferase
MFEILRLAAEVQEFMLERKWRFAFIGGVANLAWGIMRTTEDVDLTLFTSFENERVFIDEILAQYPSRISDPVRFALQARVLLLSSPKGVGIDIGLAGFPYEEAAVDRAESVDFGEGIALLVITAEDLIVMKAFASRPQDWVDVDGVVRRQGLKLDWEYIVRHVEDLAAVKEDASMMPTLMEIRARYPK